MSRKFKIPPRPRGWWPMPYNRKGYDIMLIDGIPIYYRNGYPISRVLVPTEERILLDKKLKEIKT